MSNPDKPAWLVPINRTVTYAIQPGTMYVNAANQAEAIKIARERIEADWSGAAGMEWEPVSEIQDAECPEIADDLEESDVLPVDDTAPALARYPMIGVIGVRVAAGDTDDDHDTGRVVARDGDQVTVAWDNGTRTTQHFSLLNWEPAQ